MSFTMTSDPLADPCVHLLLIPLGALAVIVLTSAFDRRSGGAMASRSETGTLRSEAGTAPMPASDESLDSVTGGTRREPGRETLPNKAQVGSYSGGGYDTRCRPLHEVKTGDAGGGSHSAGSNRPQTGRAIRDGPDGDLNLLAVEVQSLQEWEMEKRGG